MITHEFHNILQYNADEAEEIYAALWNFGSQISRSMIVNYLYHDGHLQSIEFDEFGTFFAACVAE